MMSVFTIIWLDFAESKNTESVYSLLCGVNLTKVRSAILLCILLASIVYGFTIALSAAYETPEEPATNGNHGIMLRPGHYSPMGDPIDDPKPNKK